MAEWLFDLGNTRLKCAPLEQGRVGEGFAVAHDGRALPDDWTHALPARIDSAVLASVAPAPLRASLLAALGGRCGRVSRVHTEPGFAGMRIAYAHPERLGVDRFLALLGAHARGPGPWLLVGVGTALTIDLLDRDGHHRGGRIAPSPALMRESLHRRAPHLPLQGGRHVAFADDTDDALASGCEGAACALVEASRRDAMQLVGASPTVLVHGGGAAAVLAGIEGALAAPTLVLEGMARWARGQ
ncbi:type III pantothenate kinase [Luteimonas yindakuii]|uniref:Type III pantothenate kinase n=1 Tax=Luteimonas yindakuii TaxID=2565782 RepID=A0A4Z1R018_9GAMM|nr:type III pantothenate kinase [Luteimonas yindakuii]TKS52870.1 type III pantothenate kinase [Luteimonas yindakuii]